MSAASISTGAHAEAHTHHDLVDEKIVRWYFITALIFLGTSMVAGILMAMQLIRHNPLNGIEIFSAGRWRMIHTNAVAYGFLANGFLGCLHWSIPRLTLQPVFNKHLSWLIYGAWQFVVGATAVGILFGEAQALEWGETPVWIDPVAQLGLLLVAINFMTPIARMKGPMYVTLWYFMAAFVWTFLTYAMGNFMPQYYVGGTSAGAVGGLFIHDLVGLFVTPLGWGLMYYFVPIILKKPIWSHGLSLVGFWGLAFFYPLQGIHHFLYTPIPMFLQYGAVVSTIAVELVVTTVVINFFGTLWGNAGVVKTNIPIRFFYTGMIYYFLTCLQCSFQVTLTFQKIIHFSDWVVGHAHMVMFGVFSMWIMGMMIHLFPRMLNRPWASQNLLEWHYWLSTIGVGFMAGDLILLGVFQGWSWAALEPWDASVDFSYPFWVLRVIAGLAMFGGLLAFAQNIRLTMQAAAKEKAVRA
ncbi:MAG: cbb3-type cytochrome c oxidase subunit I [Planctomyces sp.]|nr:cbb3-type cytochrome c oxidase subunit I [Planctomyces sp.]